MVHSRVPAHHFIIKHTGNKYLVSTISSNKDFVDYLKSIPLCREPFSEIYSQPSPRHLSRCTNTWLNSTFVNRQRLWFLERLDTRCHRSIVRRSRKFATGLLVTTYGITQASLRRVGLHDWRSFLLWHSWKLWTNPGRGYRKHAETRDHHPVLRSKWTRLWKTA